MASWKKITEDDGSSVQINMDNVTHMKRGKGDQITTIFFVSGAGNEIYVIARETPEQILLAQPLMVL
jgi:hypothetical protein